MEKSNRKSISDKLSKYTYSSYEHDFIEVCEWTNGEGYDITLSTHNSEKNISLSDGELDAIDYLIKSLRYAD